MRFGGLATDRLLRNDATGRSSARTRIAGQLFRKKRGKQFASREVESIMGFSGVTQSRNRRQVMSQSADIPWSLLAEASVRYVGERSIDLELARGVRISYRPTGGLTERDYDFFGIEGYEEEAIQAPSTLLPMVPTPLPSAPSVPPSTWFHGKNDSPPAAFKHGPLAGTQRDLATRTCPGKRIDTRRLHRKAAMGVSMWVRKQHRKLYEVWFLHEHDYLRAIGRVVPNPAT